MTLQMACWHTTVRPLTPSPRCVCAWQMLYGVGWERRGHDICYYQNHVKRRGGYHYTATFTIEMPRTACP